MSDYDIVLEFIQRRMPFPPESGMAAIAALDALVAERDAFKAARLDDVRLLDEREKALVRAEAAEAERDEARRERDKALLSVEGLSKRLTIAVAAEARVTSLEASMYVYADHQSWRCQHSDRYSQNPDCPCGLVQTWRDLGFKVEYDAEGSGAVLLMTRAALAKEDTA